MSHWGDEAKCRNSAGNWVRRFVSQRSEESRQLVDFRHAPGDCTQASSNSNRGEC